jgi:hypothetical protein
MPLYYVEGLYINKQYRKRHRKIGVYTPDALEPYAKTIWANSPKEAIQLATAELGGCEWTEEPKVSQVTEEQRMRSMGAPEFPGLAQKPKQTHQHVKKRKH